MASNSRSSSSFSKPSKWLPKLNLASLRRPKAGRPIPPQSPDTCRTDKFREAFRRFDANGDGKISSAELQSYFAWVGESITIQEAERVIVDLDADGDGMMDYDDFARLMKHGSSNGGAAGGGEEEDDLKQAFAVFEAEKGSGCITPCGLRRALCRLGEVRSEAECAAMIRAYDLDGNGVLDFHEFCRMMMA